MTAVLMPITPDDAAAVGRFFGLSLTSLRPDISLAGSPERSAARCAVQDVGGRVYVVERLAPATYAAKVRIADTLTTLASQGLQHLSTYLTDVRGEHVVRYGGSLWQITPYLSGVALPRPDWVTDAWRGEALGQFLLNLRTASHHLMPMHQTPAFDLAGYVHALGQAIQANQPELVPALEPVRVVLAPFFAKCGTLPISFCHGDYHPLNVIWGTSDLCVVIDWEFCGYKLALYDVANLIGCVGVEEPRGLSGDLVRRLLDIVGTGDLANAKSWRWLPELVLALRFAWLSEWLRKNDREMIEMEQCYMALLVSQREHLRSQWLSWVKQTPMAV